jgi:hypothetical protein
VTSNNHSPRMCLSSLDDIGLGLITHHRVAIQHIPGLVRLKLFCHAPDSISPAKIPCKLDTAHEKNLDGITIENIFIVIIF